MMSLEHIEDDTYKGRLNFALWRRIAGHARPYRRPLGGLAVSGLVIAAVDVLFPFVTGRVIDAATEHGLTPALYGYGVMYAGLIITFAACVWWFIMLAGQVATGVGYDLRTKAFARLQSPRRDEFGQVIDKLAIEWILGLAIGLKGQFAHGSIVMEPIRHG